VSINWLEASAFERRSCLGKRRWPREPPLPSMMFRAYACSFCGGWHLATRLEFKPGVAIGPMNKRTELLQAAHDEEFERIKRGSEPKKGNTET
jgi:hypothetical protein